LARAGLDADAHRPAVKISLPPEQVVRGRLVDLQGVPARKVTVGVTRVARKSWPWKSPDVDFRDPPRGLATWPGGATTDAQGRFEVRGLSADQTVTLLVSDDRFARQRLVIPAAGKGKPRPANFSLAPGFVIEGAVTFTDSGKPVRNMQVHVQLVLTPGTAGVGPVTKKGPAADACYLANLDRDFRGPNRLRSDARGRLTLPPLIPGATFLLIGTRPDGGIFNLDKEFKAEAGKTIDLGDVVVKPPN
jgi:hypothetical protein